MKSILRFCCGLFIAYPNRKQSVSRNAAPLCVPGINVKHAVHDDRAKAVIAPPT
jgi:hypothetical protein